MKGSQRSQTGEQIMEDTRPSSDVSRNIYINNLNNINYVHKRCILRSISYKYIFFFFYYICSESENSYFLALKLELYLLLSY